jgi:hypothetical protein
MENNIKNLEKYIKFNIENVKYFINSSTILLLEENNSNKKNYYAINELGINKVNIENSSIINSSSLYLLIKRILNIRNYFKDFKLVAKVVKNESSGKIFGYNTLKNKTLNNYYEINDIIFDYIPKNNENLKLNIASLKINEERCFKYCLSDLEIYIFIDKKLITSLNFPKKDRNFVPGCHLKVVNNKYTNLNKNEIVNLIKIKPNKDSKRLFKNSNTRALDIVTIKRGNGEILQSYAKNFKRIYVE